MKASKLTSKFQTTVPQEIRNFLNLSHGDAVSFEIENDMVILKKISAVDFEYLKSIELTLSSEWSSKNDEDAYGSL